MKKKANPKKAHKIVKKFRDLTPAEEAKINEVMEAGEGAIAVIVQFLEEQITALDKKMYHTDQLYDRPGADLYVAVLLARREVHLKLRNLLLDKIELDESSLEE